MRKLFFILLAFILSGCEFRNIEITGTATGMDGSTVTIKDKKGGVIFAENIKAGKFHIVQQLLKEPGYYILEVSTNERRTMPNSFEVYLEPGEYDITLSENSYPNIQSASVLQKDLAAYYHLKDSLTSYTRSQYDLWLGKLNASDANRLPQSVYDEVLNNVKIWQDKQQGMEVKILETLVTKQPDNLALPHVLQQLNLKKDPIAFYKIYQKSDPAVKNSDEGKAVGQTLQTLTDLVKGVNAPKLTGKSPDGKEFDMALLNNKKAVIINFWRSSSSMSRDEHQAIIQNLLPKLKANNVAIVSFCIDTDRSEWIESIKKRKLTWPQFNDLKGNDSPNITNWDVSLIPVYYLLDSKGNIVEPDMDYKQLLFTLDEYLAKH